MTIQHILSVVVSSFEILFGALVAGFPFLVFALQDEGYFSDICSSDDVTNLTVSESINVSLTTTIVTSVTSQSYPTCNEQEETFAFVYSVLIAVMAVGSFTNGFIVSKFGTWISKLIGISLYLSGCLLFATSSNEKSWVLYIATSLLSVGASFFYFCSVPFANLFPNIRSTIIAIFTGTVGSSTIICWLILLAHRNGISFRHSFYLLSGWSVVSFVATFFLSPKKHIPENVDENFTYGIQNKCRKSTTTDEEQLGSLKTNKGHKNTSTIQILTSIWKCMKTKFFLSTGIHFWIIGFRNLFFIGTFPVWIRTFGNDDEIRSYIDAFAIFTLLSGFTSPVIGIIADALINRFRKQNMPDELCKLKSCAICGFIVSGITLLFTILAAIPILPLQYFSFFCYMLFRSSLFSYVAICITSRFSLHLFGMLFGALNMVSGFCIFLAQPLLSLVLNTFDGDFLFVDIVFVCLVLISFIHPISLYFEYRTKQRQNVALVTNRLIEN